MKSSKFIAVVVAVIAIVWIVSGFLIGGSGPEASTPPASSQAEKKIMDVRVREIIAEQYTNHVVVTGRTRASKTVELKAEIEGQLQSLLKEEGDEISDQELLAELELRDRAEKLKEVKQRLNQRRIEYNAAKKLEGKGFNSKVRLAQAQADLESARAEVKLAEVELSKVKILSPFDGVIFEQMVEEGDYLSVGDTIFTVVDLDPIEFVGFVSERHMQHIALGTEASAEFLNGVTVMGKVSYIAPAADPQTRTFRVVVSAGNPDFLIKEGLTAKFSVPLENRKAHKISPSILSLNDAGQIGVKIVNDENRVEFIPVKIISDQPKQMWILGPPEKARIITVGQDFVSEGQVVNPVLSKGEGLL